MSHSSNKGSSNWSSKHGYGYGCYGYGRGCYGCYPWNYAPAIATRLAIPRAIRPATAARARKPAARRSARNIASRLRSARSIAILRARSIAANIANRTATGAATAIIAGRGTGATMTVGTDQFEGFLEDADQQRQRQSWRLDGWQGGNGPDGQPLQRNVRRARTTLNGDCNDKREISRPCLAGRGRLDFLASAILLAGENNRNP